MNSRKILLAAAILLLSMQVVVVKTAQPSKKESLAESVDEATRKVLPSNTIRAPRVIKKQSKMIAVLDDILKPRPQIIYLMDKTREKALIACDEIFVWEQLDKEKRAEEEAFVISLKGPLLKFVRKFMDVVLENKSMLTPIVEECLGHPSEHLKPFFDSKPGKVDAFLDGISTTKQLNGIALEVSTIIGDLMYKENLSKSVPTYHKWNEERKNKKKK